MVRTNGGADPGAPAPIVGTSTIRANGIDKLNSKATLLKGSWGKLGNVLEFHPNLFSIHNAKVFKHTYPGVVEIAPQTIYEAILSYSTMSETDRREVEFKDQDQTTTSAISRLSFF